MCSLTSECKVEHQYCEGWNSELDSVSVTQPSRGFPPLVNLKTTYAQLVLPVSVARNGTENRSIQRLVHLGEPLLILVESIRKSLHLAMARL